MASTGARTLTLLALLEARRYWPGDELAARMGVSARTLRRDVERLRDLGYPVEAARGVGGGYQLGAGASLPPLVLDDEEAVALVVGLHVASDATIAGVAESSVRALTKTLALLPPRLRARADALRTTTVVGTWRGGVEIAPEILDVVARACHDGVRLGFSYTARDAATSERYVEPYRLVVLARRWYLLAFDIDRADWRTFRVDRIRDPRATVGRFTPRDAPDDPAAFVRGSIERMPGRHEVVVDVASSAATVERRIGRWATVEPVDAARCVVRIASDELEWPILALAQLDADFVVREPPELVAQVATLGERFTRATGAVSARRDPAAD
ncbi:MAG: YafY family protein [Acidimicrobiia bacterium]